MEKNVNCHILRDYQLSGWEEEIVGKWHYRDLIANPEWKTGWISFDAITWDSEVQKLYCGLNSIDGDLLYTFDPDSKTFDSLHTQRWTDEFDAKIHRTILKNPQDGCYYFGTSLLHDADQQEQAQGGKLVKFDPKTKEFDILGIPFPHLYLQSIAADFQRGLLYAFTYPGEFVIQFHLETRKSKILGYVGNAIMMAQPHNGVVDKYGRLWGTYAETRAWDAKLSHTPIRLFSFDPESGKFTWYTHGLSKVKDKEQLIPDPAHLEGVEFDKEDTRHPMDYGFCDSMIYDGDQFIYAGTTSGVLCRVDINSTKVQKIAQVTPGRRLPALTFDKNGFLYAAGGNKSRIQLIRYNPATLEIQDFGDIRDQEGRVPQCIHEIAIDEKGTIYLAENDNHHRSSYLWTISN